MLCHCTEVSVMMGSVLYMFQILHSIETEVKAYKWQKNPALCFSFQILGKIAFFFIQLPACSANSHNWQLSESSLNFTPLLSKYICSKTEYQFTKKHQWDFTGSLLWTGSQILPKVSTGVNQYSSTEVMFCWNLLLDRISGQLRV